jgi:hypothetical protein
MHHNSPLSKSGINIRHFFKHEISNKWFSQNKILITYSDIHIYRIFSNLIQTRFTVSEG